MKILRTKEEFVKFKDEFKKKLDTLLSDYDEFTRGLSPKHWRSIGGYGSELKKLRSELDRDLEPITLKDLENDFVRDTLLTDEEKELYNNTTKYNL